MNSNRMSLDKFGRYSTQSFYSNKKRKYYDSDSDYDDDDVERFIKVSHPINDSHAVNKKFLEETIKVVITELENKIRIVDQKITEHIISVDQRIKTAAQITESVKKDLQLVYKELNIHDITEQD